MAAALVTVAGMLACSAASAPNSTWIPGARDDKDVDVAGSGSKSPRPATRGGRTRRGYRRARRARRRARCREAPTRAAWSNCSCGPRAARRALVPWTPWIIGIERPLDGVVDDILADRVQFALVAYDSLIVVQLPDRHTRRMAYSIDLLCGHRLERSNQLSQRLLATRSCGSRAATRRSARERNDPMEMIRHDDKVI